MRRIGDTLSNKRLSFGGRIWDEELLDDDELGSFIVLKCTSQFYELCWMFCDCQQNIVSHS